MSGSRSITSTDAPEYELIEATMSESARGRWFLQEYARRNRTADTEMLFGAIERLEGVVTAERNSAPGPDTIDRVRVDLMDMANAIARTKVEVAAIHAPDGDHSRLGVALDAIVHTTERATSDILGAAEHVQEVAWTLREAGSDDAVCDELDRMATRIYTACSFQDITAQRTARIIHTLRYLEERLGAMMAVWGDELGDVPAQNLSAEVPEEELCQSDVDRYIGMDGVPATASHPKPELPDAASLEDELLFVENSQDDDDMSVEAPVEDPTDPVSENAEAASEAATLDMADAEEISTLPSELLADATAEDEEWPVQTDIETAFADIDRLTPEEKSALFS